MNIGPFNIISNSGELDDIILEEIDYGLLAINTGIFAVVPSPPPVTSLPANTSYIDVCQKLDLTQHTTYPKTRQTISFVPSNSKVPITIVIEAGPPWPSPPYPPKPKDAPTRYLLSLTNYHSWQ